MIHNDLLLILQWNIGKNDDKANAEVDQTIAFIKSEPLHLILWENGQQQQLALSSLSTMLLLVLSWPWHLSTTSSMNVTLPWYQP
jgi:hypothetical protein